MSKLRSRDGFTQNRSNVWGHCEEEERLASGHVECFNRTLYRCDICKQFVCADHQRRHKQENHVEAA